MAAKPKKSSAALELEHLAAMMKEKGKREARQLLSMATREGRLAEFLAQVPGLERIGAATITVIEQRVKMKDRFPAMNVRMADLADVQAQRVLESELDSLGEQRRKLAARDSAAAASKTSGEPTSP